MYARSGKAVCIMQHCSTIRAPPRHHLHAGCVIVLSHPRRVTVEFWKIYLRCCIDPGSSWSTQCLAYIALLDDERLWRHRLVFCAAILNSSITACSTAIHINAPFNALLFQTDRNDGRTTFIFIASNNSWPR